MKAKLTTVDPWAPALDLEIDHWPVVIGSRSDCDVQVSDRWISSRHCEIGLEDGCLVVRDLESANGTLIDGRPVQYARLLPRQTLTIGIRAFRVSYRPSNRRRNEASARHDQQCEV